MFVSNLNKLFCIQMVKILIRHRIMRCLIWICSVCLCPIKRLLGLYGLITFQISYEFQLPKITIQKLLLNGLFLVLFNAYRLLCSYHFIES